MRTRFMFRRHVLQLVALLLLALLALPVRAAAQTAIDLAALGLANHDLQFVDLDANPDTLEAVAFDKANPGVMRVILIRQTVCIGAPFNPRPSLFSALKIARIGRIDQFQIITGNSLLLLPIPQPIC